MIDEATFRRESDRALESLKQSLIAAEDDDGTFEFEDNNGVMNIIFENGSSQIRHHPQHPHPPGLDLRPGHQLQTRWSEAAHAFTLPKTGEDLKTLTQRLLREHLADPTITPALICVSGAKQSMPKHLALVGPVLSAGRIGTNHLHQDREA